VHPQLSTGGHLAGAGKPMTTVLSLILLPLRAPMLLLLLLVSTYLGLHWSRPGSWADAGMSGVTDLIWSAECLQALVIVVVCTMPDLLLRRISSIMAASRVASLVITLLLVVTGGLYLLHLEVLSNVLILSSSVLLARLDLVRLRVVPPPFVMTMVLTLLVLGGVSLGRMLELQLRPYVSVPQETRVPASARRSPPSPGDTAPSTPGRMPAGAKATLAQPPTAGPQPGAAASTSQSASGGEEDTRSNVATPAHAPASADRPASSSAHNHPAREPDRAIPHLQENAAPSEEP
jgi:hypothetical protein